MNSQRQAVRGGKELGNYKTSCKKKYNINTSLTIKNYSKYKGLREYMLSATVVSDSLRLNGL